MPTDDDPEGNDGGDGSTGSRNVQQLRKHAESLEAQLKAANDKAALADAAEARALAAEAKIATFTRSATFDELRIPNTGAGKLFRDTYQGELTPEAIVAAAVSYEIVPTPATQAAQPTVPGVDQDAWARMQASLPGTTTPTATTAIDEIKAATPENIDALLQRFGVLGHPS